MKPKPLLTVTGLLAFFVVALLFTGCATGSRSGSNVVQVTRAIGSPLQNDAVYFFIKRGDDHTYDLTAFGYAYHTDQQYLDAWARTAGELAAGRRYEKQTTIEPAYYQSSGSPSGLVDAEVGTIVKGRIVMK